MSFIVMTASARMPSSCWGHYRRVAVIEMDDDWLAVQRMRDVIEGRRPRRGPAMISERARGVVRIVATWERRHVGSTERCAYIRAIGEAQSLIDRLTAEDAHQQWSTGGQRLDRDF